MSNLYGIEIPWTCVIGKGLYLGHAFNITVNPDVKIGDNCNLHKGITIGQQNRGLKKGTPIIGNCVWIGVNATVVGNVVIGDDVLIAPGAFVNCDVPSHSVVIGNPCQIHHRDNATEEYICDRC
jgi:serine O-acetyltransferase